MKVDYTNLPEILCPLCDSDAFEMVTTRFDGGRIVKCHRCGHVYLNPPLSKEMLDSIYREYLEVQGEEACLKEITERWFQDPRGPYQYALRVIEKQGGFSGKRVFEIGCGHGRFLEECRRRGAQVTGLDTSPKAVLFVKQCYGLEIIPVSIEQAIQENRLSPGSFDLLFAFELIEHVYKPGDLLQDLHRLTAPGGFFILSTPNFYLFHLMGNAAPTVNNWPEHLHFFEPETLTRCLERAGFEPMIVTTVDSWSPTERQKQALSRVTLVHAIWQAVRRFRVVYFMKDVIFRLLSRREEAADRMGWNGTGLVGVARKTGRSQRV